MKSYHLIIIGICIFLSCKKSNQYQDLPNQGKITLLSYNVAGLPEGINADQFPTKHIPLISPLLNAYDVVNIQEDFAYHEILFKQITLPYQSKYVANVVFGDGLNTISKIPFSGFKRIKWHSCAGTDCLTPKGFSYCKLRINENTSIDLYNVHCNAGSDNKSLAARRNNIEQLANYIKTNSTGNAVILMGDFNCRYTRSQDEIRKIPELGFTDTWIELIRENIIPEKNDMTLNDCEIATHRNCEVVDKFFYKSNEKINLKAIQYQLDSNLFYDKDGMPLSDHNPLFTILQYQVNQ